MSGQSQVVARKREQMERQIQKVAAEVDGPPPPCRLAEARAGDAPDFYTAPRFARAVPLAWSVVVGAATGHRCYSVSAFDQSQSEVAHVLRRRGDVGVERLIENENSHALSRLSDSEPTEPGKEPRFMPSRRATACRMVAVLRSNKNHARAHTKVTDASTTA